MLSAPAPYVTNAAARRGRDAGSGVRRKADPWLVAEHVERQPLRFIQRLEQRQCEVSRDAEHLLDAVVDERLDQCVCEFHR